MERTTIECDRCKKEISRGWTRAVELKVESMSFMSGSFSYHLCSKCRRFLDRLMGGATEIIEILPGRFGFEKKIKEYKIDTSNAKKLHKEVFKVLNEIGIEDVAGYSVTAEGSLIVETIKSLKSTEEN